jgi:hypothetical protein
MSLAGYPAEHSVMSLVVGGGRPTVNTKVLWFMV